MAEMISTQDIVNVKRDIDDTGKAVNEDAVITPRYGDPFKSVPMVVRELMENGGFMPFSTEAELLAHVPTVSPSAAYAFDTKKLYKWNGTTWVDEGLSALDQAKEFTQDQITELGFQRGINIFDKSKVEYSKYYNYLTGEKGDASSEFSAAGLYEIEGNTEYRVPENYTQQFAFFDSLKNYISGQENAGPAHKFTAPANAKYIGLTVGVSLLDTFMLCKSSEYPASYVPFTVTKSDLRVSGSQVNNLMPDVKNELGFIYINIIDTTKVINGYYVNWQNGQLGDVAGYSALGPYEIKPNTEYQASDFYNQQFAFYDANMTYVGGQPNPNLSHKFTTPSNAKYIRLSILTPQLNSLVVSETSLFPSSYVPYTAKKIDGLITDDVKTTKIFASADVNDTTAAFTGKNAIQLALDSITDASEQNRYRIIAKGIFKVDQAADYIGYLGYPSMILAKDNVEIVGDGNTVVSAELPYNDAEIGLSVDGGNYPRTQYQTLYTYAEDSLIEGITFVAKNTRYALHLDNSNGANKTHRFKNCNFIFKGNKGSVQALGCGTSTGEEAYFDGGMAHSDAGIPFYLHNNVKFEKPSLFNFNNFTYSSNTNVIAILLQSNGSLVKDKLDLTGCGFGGTAYVIYYWQNWLSGNTTNKNDSFDHAEWRITGYGLDPFLFENVVGGECLRFKTTSADTSSNIRFDKTSSAFPLLIKNNQNNADASLYLDGREFIDGYIVQDGSVDLSALAWGCKDLSESAYALDAGVNYTSLGKRLGNCSSSNKTLGVIINGTTNIVTFNKDYTSMSNAAILAEINAALTGATADLYIYGRDYYPMMPDVTEVVYNTTATYIPKGSVVAKDGGSVRLAQTGDKIYGVALDDIPVMQTMSDGSRKGQGRVLKRGYIYANQGRTHFVLSDNQNPQLGTRFSVNNGQLVTDVNGKISVDIDEGVVSINC
ncbi:hypothetical protein [Acinetobacter junii]|uniref:hypothetical protein n=1 Tax=Acinetobacter junii TaxID=40215 RepID=UPI00124BF760|nr:hypothetical protein [Acinetobacter junii]